MYTDLYKLLLFYLHGFPIYWLYLSTAITLVLPATILFVYE